SKPASLSSEPAPFSADTRTQEATPAAAFAAAGRASAIRSSAASVCAVGTNQAAHGEGGREVPAASRELKKRVNASVSCAFAAVYEPTGASRKNTENKVPAVWITCGTPAAERASPTSCCRRVLAAAMVS